MKFQHRVLGMLSLLAVITYLDRVCIAVAGPRMQDALHISPEAWGWVTSVFFLSYSAFEIPTGALGDRIGPRRVLTRVVVWWSTFTTLTGTVSSYVPVVCLRRHPVSAANPLRTVSRRRTQARRRGLWLHEHREQRCVGVVCRRLWLHGWLFRQLQCAVRPDGGAAVAGGGAVAAGRRDARPVSRRASWRIPHRPCPPIEPGLANFWSTPTR